MGGVSGLGGQLLMFLQDAFLDCVEVVLPLVPLLHLEDLLLLLRQQLEVLDLLGLLSRLLLRFASRFLLNGRGLAGVGQGLLRL